MSLKRFLRAKLHTATVTEADLEYEGSITIDEELMEVAGIMPYEFVLVSNANNGERFETYVIPGTRGAGDICLNGATARKGLVGDRLFIFSHIYLTEDEQQGYEPKIIMLDERNRPIKVI